MTIPSSVIEDIRIKSDIVAVVEKYLPELKKSGRNWRARCPFHTEKTPSFFVNPDKGIYHCFGCGATGDVFKFVQNMEKVSWPEAVKKVGQWVGVAVKYDFKADENSLSAESIERKNVYDALEAASEIYHKTLFQTYAGKNALEYLQKSRSLTPETIEKFRIGFSEGNIFQELLKKGISPETIIKSGLVKPPDAVAELKDSKNYTADQRYYEYMSGRVVFPIRDVYGRTVAFGGRILDEGRQPKYLNTPESIVYTKGRHLYGLYEGSQRIKKSSEIIIVEGYLDVIVAHQALIQNAVSCLGTAFTEYHASLISRFVKRVALMFDPDTAGLAGAVRAAENLMSSSGSAIFEFYVVSLPSKMDPDEYILKNGAREFIEYIRKNKKNFFDFHCDYLISKNGGINSITPQRKVSIIHDEIFQNVEHIKNPLLVQEVLKIISDKLKIPVSTINAEYSLFLRRKNSKRKIPNTASVPPGSDISAGSAIKKTSKDQSGFPSDSRSRAVSSDFSGLDSMLSREETLAGILLFHPRYASRFKEDMFCDEKCRLVWKKISEINEQKREKGEENSGSASTNIMDLFPETLRGWISALALRCPYGQEETSGVSSIDEIVDKIFFEMETAMIMKRVEVLKEEIHEMILKGQIDKSKNDEFNSLVRRLKLPPSSSSPPHSGG